MKPRLAQLGLLAAAGSLVGTLIAGGISLAQPRSSGRSPAPAAGGFSFARLQYDSSGGPGEAFYWYEGRSWERWETDYPQADENFVFRFGELTAARPEPQPVKRRLTDPDLFSFPVLYLCDVGWMVLDDREVALLREYLARGGFIWADDFWGDAEWRNFERVMLRVLPDARWEPIPDDHPILTTLFPLPSLPQVPAKDFADQGWPWDQPFSHRQPAGAMTPANFRGYFDANRRLLAVATHNTDIGDGWEREAYGEDFFERYSTVSYATGVNIVLFALTH